MGRSPSEYGRGRRFADRASARKGERDAEERERRYRCETRSSGLWGTGRGGRGSDGRNATLEARPPGPPRSRSRGSAGGERRLGRAGQRRRQLPRPRVRDGCERDAERGRARDRPERRRRGQGAGRPRRVRRPRTARGSRSWTPRPDPCGPGLARPRRGLRPRDRSRHARRPRRAARFKDTKEKKKLPRGHSPHDFTSSELWTSAVGVDSLWPSLPGAHPESAAGSEESLHRVHRLRDRSRRAATSAAASSRRWT